MSSERVETVVIGGGQAGLATSYHLGQRGREHVVLEASARAGNAWRTGRWDSFTLVTPNWAFKVPGAGYEGGEPQAFMLRDEVVSRFEHYVEDHRLPVRFGVRATSVDRTDAGEYVVTTDAGSIAAENVVVATGLYQQHKVLSFGADLPADIEQIHSGQYRNPDSLQDGAVLVVGSAQSGCQIAQELYQHGRKVYLCVGGAGRMPRRYRGRDLFEWLRLVGFFETTVDELPSPQAKFAGNPHLSGRDGGQTLNLHQFARDGVVLLGHLRGVIDDRLEIEPDVKQSLAKADALEVQITATIDRYIADHGIDAPPEALPALTDGFDAEEITSLSLADAGITTVIWAVGYTFDFSMIKLPVLAGDGFPIQQGGVTEYPGLYFVGMPWMPKRTSGLLLGFGEGAEHVASQIAAR